MRPDQQAVVKALVVVAWADGAMHDQEQALLEALIAAFELDERDAAWVRHYAHTPRTLAELPEEELGHDQRRLLLQHAITLIHADGEQADSELATVRALAQRLLVPPGEAEEIIAAAARRARRLPALR
jgi:tellurite resistance protein